MNSAQQHKNILDYSALIYLYVPIFLFLLTWIQLVIAIPLICLTVVGMVISVRGGAAEIWL